MRRATAAARSALGGAGGGPDGIGGTVNPWYGPNGASGMSAPPVNRPALAMSLRRVSGARQRVCAKVRTPREGVGAGRRAGA
ncbi:hypothetical protein GCM10017776_13170 [Streptomyces griseoluteus]|nr:hypothetical protein GCM10017776_13170 [Streptomyces griseoluteus]